MKYRGLVLTLVLGGLALFSLAPVAAQANPFLSGNSPVATPAPADLAAPTGETTVFQQIFHWISDQQRALRMQLGDSFTAFVQTGSAGVIWALLLASFLYGIVHTLLPGHRKGVIISYFLSEQARVYHGVVAGLAFGILHVLGAIILVGGAWLILASSFAQRIDQMTRAMEIVSGAGIVALGLIMLIGKIRHLRQHRHGSDDHSHSHADHHHHGHDHDHAHGAVPDQEPAHGDHRPDQPPTAPARLAPMAIISGIVPCPGSVLVMISGLSLGVPGLAIAALVAMSLGIALTLMLIAFAAILFKTNVVGFAERKTGHALHAWVELGGVALILLSGVLLLASGQSF